MLAADQTRGARYSSTAGGTLQRRAIDAGRRRHRRTRLGGRRGRGAEHVVGDDRSVRLGAGTRGKIAHAFGRKCPVVSTTLGAYGYGVANGRELFLGDSASDFASACVRAIRQPSEAAEMAERAWQQFLEKWAWDAIRPRVWAAAEDCLRLSRDTSAC